MITYILRHLDIYRYSPLDIYQHLLHLVYIRTNAIDTGYRRVEPSWLQNLHNFAMKIEKFSCSRILIHLGHNWVKNLMKRLIHKLLCEAY